MEEESVCVIYQYECVTGLASHLRTGHSRRRDFQEPERKRSPFQEEGQGQEEGH